MDVQWKPFEDKLNPYYPIKNKDTRAQVHNYYCANVEALGFKLNGGTNLLFSPKGIALTHGYTRVVIGDFGAYVEISTEQIVKENLIVKAGQEFRIGDPKYKDSVKYNWLTVEGDEDVKVYYQKRTVAYADYKVGMIYIDPRELIIGE